MVEKKKWWLYVKLISSHSQLDTSKVVIKKNIVLKTFAIFKILFQCVVCLITIFNFIFTYDDLFVVS